MEQFRSVVKNLRVSENAIEFDLYVIDDNLKTKSLEKLSKKFGDVLTARNLDSDNEFQSKDSVIKETISLFNQQRYWESHETLEQIWRREPKGPEKDVQQGIILAASAMVHFQKNENDVCLGMIPSALAKINQWREAKYYGVSIIDLKRNLLQILESKIIAPFEI